MDKLLARSGLLDGIDEKDLTHLFGCTGGRERVQRGGADLRGRRAPVSLRAARGLRGVCTGRHVPRVRTRRCVFVRWRFHLCQGAFTRSGVPRGPFSLCVRRFMRLSPPVGRKSCKSDLTAVR